MGKNQGYRHIKQELDVNWTNMGKLKMIDIENNTVAFPYKMVKPIRVSHLINNDHIVHIVVIYLYYIETTKVHFCHSFQVFTPYTSIIIEPQKFELCW